MAKKLTMVQLNEIGVYNPHEFCRGWWYLDYTAYSRQTMGNAGWKISIPGKPSTESPHHRAYAVFSCGNGNIDPHGNQRICAKILELGLTVPMRWVKFMGVWMDGDFYEVRMASLVKKWKAMGVAEKYAL